MPCLDAALKFLPVHAMKTYWGSRGIVPLILNVGTKWRWVFSFTSQLLYSQERTQFSLNRGWVFTMVWRFWLRGKYLATCCDSNPE
jgi:hypothetical protein